MSDVLINKIFSKTTSLADIVSSIDEFYFSNLEMPSSLHKNITNELIFSELQILNTRSDVDIHWSTDLSEFKVVCKNVLNEPLHVIVKINLEFNNFTIADCSAPHASYHDDKHTSLIVVVDAFCKQIDSLKEYFIELNRLDEMCWVIDPDQPSFKDNYRRIVLEDGVWLQVEISPDGSASRVRVLGATASAQPWRERLHNIHAAWDQDVGIAENLLNVLELTEFPARPATAHDTSQQALEEEQRDCAICLCRELPSTGRGLPRPLCANVRCGRYFHTACLYQWLVSCGGGTAPRFGVAVGSCPHCLTNISCAEDDA